VKGEDGRIKDEDRRIKDEDGRMFAFGVPVG